MFPISRFLGGLRPQTGGHYFSPAVFTLLWICSCSSEWQQEAQELLFLSWPLETKWVLRIKSHIYSISSFMASKMGSFDRLYMHLNFHNSPIFLKFKVRVMNLTSADVVLVPLSLFYNYMINNMAFCEVQAIQPILVSENSYIYIVKENNIICYYINNFLCTGTLLFHIFLLPGSSIIQHIHPPNLPASLCLQTELLPASLSFLILSVTFGTLYGFMNCPLCYS